MDLKESSKLRIEKDFLNSYRIKTFHCFLFPVSHLLVFILPRRSLIAVLVVVMLSLSGGYSALFFIELKITLV